MKAQRAAWRNIPCEATRIQAGPKRPTSIFATSKKVAKRGPRELLAGGPVVDTSVGRFMLFWEFRKFLGLDCIAVARGRAATGRSVGISIGASLWIPPPEWATSAQRAGDHLPPECVSFWPRNGFKLARGAGAIWSQNPLRMDSGWRAAVPISEAGSHPIWPRIGNLPAVTIQ